MTSLGVESLSVTVRLLANMRLMHPDLECISKGRRLCSFMKLHCTFELLSCGSLESRVAKIRQH
jgi:hypothetical protein